MIGKNTIRRMDKKEVKCNSLQIVNSRERQRKHSGPRDGNKSKFLLSFIAAHIVCLRHKCYVNKLQPTACQYLFSK